MSEERPQDSAARPASTPVEIRDLLRRARESPGGLTASLLRERESLPRTRATLEAQDYEQDIKLKKWYGIALLIGLGVQVLVVDTLVFLYAWRGVGWNVKTSVMQVWLGATVIEAVGIVYVVTRYLFPRRDIQA